MKFILILLMSLGCSHLTPKEKKADVYEIIFNSEQDWITSTNLFKSNYKKENKEKIFIIGFGSYSPLVSSQEDKVYQYQLAETRIFKVKQTLFSLERDVISFNGARGEEVRLYHNLLEINCHLKNEFINKENKVFIIRC